MALGNQKLGNQPQLLAFANGLRSSAYFQLQKKI